MARAKTSPAKIAKIKRDSKAWYAAIALAADHAQVILDNDAAAEVSGAEMIQPVRDAAKVICEQFMLLDCEGNDTSAKAFYKQLGTALEVKTQTARVLVSNARSITTEKAAVEAALAANRYKKGMPYKIATVWKYARDYTEKGAASKAKRDAAKAAPAQSIGMVVDPNATEPEPEWKFNERLIERSRSKPVKFTAKSRKSITTLVNQACQKLEGNPDAIRAIGLELLERANDLREKAASA
jgi:hypothetical protein